MKKALSLSKVAQSRDEVPLGAVLVHEDNVIGKGFNLRESKKVVTAHAEIRAIENYSRKFKSWRLPKGSIVYVPLEPCLMCTGALLQARVSTIVYACKDTKKAGMNLFKSWIAKNRFDHIIEIIQLREFEDEASQMLSNYFKMKRQSLKR